MRNKIQLDENLSNEEQYAELIKTANRQLGQFARLVGKVTGIPVSEIEKIAIHEKLYKPLMGRKPNKRNVQALKKRIEGMTQTKVSNAVEDIASEKWVVAIDNFIAELTDGSPITNVSPKAKTISEKILRNLTSLVKRAVKENGAESVGQKLFSKGSSLREKMKRLVWIYYSEGYRGADGKIAMDDFSSDLYDVYSELGGRRSDATNVSKKVREIMDYYDSQMVPHKKTI